MQPQRLIRLTFLLFLLLALISASLGAATSKLGLQTGSVTDPCVYAYMRANFRIDNFEAGAINANTLTVRFYFNSAEAVSTAAGFLLYIYNSAGTYQGWTSITATSTAMGSTCTIGGRSANRYVDYTFGSFSIPAGGYASPNGGYVDITRAGAGAFDSACDDYSGTASAGFNQINRMTLYQSGSLVCEYSDASTQDPNSGVEPCSGASGCGAAASPTPSATPAQSPTRTASATPVQSPTRSASPTPVLSATATPTRTASPAVYQSPTVTPTPQMALVKSANVSQAMLGDTITFYLNWSNDSSATQPFSIWDSLSPALTYVGCNNSCSVSGSTVSWSFSAAAGSSGQVAVWARISGYP